MQYGKPFILLGLVAALLHPEGAAAQERATSFADLRFGADPSTVLDTMKRLNLVAEERIPNQRFPLDQHFEGELKGAPALVAALYDATGHLEKIMISFITADEDCVRLYRTLKQDLKNQYGAPMVDVERWDFPYANGGHVGQEHFAIRVGRGVLATAWDRQDAGSHDGGVSLMTTENVTVRLAYESSRWSAESDRRKRILGAEADAPQEEFASHDAFEGGRGER